MLQLFMRVKKGRLRALGAVRDAYFFIIYALANMFGAFFWIALRKRRRQAIASIAKRLQVSMGEAEAIARKSFKENFQSFFECLLIPFFSVNHPRFRLARPGSLDFIRNIDRPIVATSGHFGSWELLAALVGAFSDKKQKAVVVRTYKNALVQFLTTRLRSSKGTLVLGHRRAVFPVLRILNKSGVVAFLVDHNTSSDEAFFLPFLGEIAAVNKGPALLAVRAKAVVLPFFLERSRGGYVFQAEAPLDTRLLEGGIEEKAYLVAKYYTEAVEKAVRRSPSQWFWMHNRWKTRPKGAE